MRDVIHVLRLRTLIILMSPMLLMLLMLLMLPTPLVVRADADTEIPLFHYGVGDGKLGAPTAFAESWKRPTWVPDKVKRDWPGVAIADLPPGTLVRITVVRLPSWADSWPELDGVIGRSTTAFVADRPGESRYADAWWGVFGRLAPHWVGVVYVRIEVIGEYESSSERGEWSREGSRGRGRKQVR